MGNEPCVILEATSHGIAHRFVLAHPFGDDVLGSRDGSVGVGHLVTVNKLSRTLLDVPATLRHDDFGERLKSQLAGSLGASFALGLVRQIDVLQRVGIPAVIDAVGEFRSQFVLRLDGLEDGGTALFQLAVVAQPLVNGLDGKVVEVACHLLAVSGYKRNGGSLLQQ